MSVFLKRFADLVRVCYLHIISETIPTRFYWLTCREKNLSKVKHCSKDSFRKRIDTKIFLFIETNNLIVLAVQSSVKYFFDPNFPILLTHVWQKNIKNTGNCKALCISRKRKKQWNFTIDLNLAIIKLSQKDGQKQASCKLNKEKSLSFFPNNSQERGISQRLLDKYSHLFIFIPLKWVLSSEQKRVYTVKTLMQNKQPLLQCSTLREGYAVKFFCQSISWLI